MATIYLLVFLFFVGVFVVATFSERDFFPFSRYPMFSRMLNIESVRVIRLQLETVHGELIWWNPSFFRYAEIIGKKLSEIERLKGKIHSEEIILFEQKKIIAEVIRLIAVEGNPVENLKSVHIVERRFDTEYKIKNKTLNIVTLPLKR